MLRRLWPFRIPRPVRRDRWDLADPLLWWSRRDAWTVGDSVMGTLVAGATGSGKSTGPGRAMAMAMLRAGYGGLVLAAKPDEAAQWERYCREAGRSADLIVVLPGGPWTFNPLDHEARRGGAGAGLCENVVAMLAAISEIADRGGAGSGGGRDDEGYWRRALRQLIRNFTELLIQATGGVSFEGLYRAVVSAPSSPEDKSSEAWRQSSYCYALLTEADARTQDPERRRDLELVAEYTLVEFPALSEKTRSIVVSSLTGTLDPLLRRPLRGLFGGASSFTPEDSEGGKVIVCGLDVKEYGEVGLMANAILKHAWQRSIERRNVARSPRPCFLWADEAQHFVSKGTDMLFATTCRSSRAALVLLTQSVSNLRAALGGSHAGEAEADSILGNLGHKLALANGDAATNAYFSNLGGRTRQLFLGGGTSRPEVDWASAALGMAGSGQTSGSFQEQMEFEVDPAAYTRLRTGGVLNKRLVDAILFRVAGRPFRATGRHWMPVAFRQGGA